MYLTQLRKYDTGFVISINSHSVEQNKNLRKIL